MNSFPNKNLNMFVLSQIILTAILFVSPEVMAINQCVDLFKNSERIITPTKSQLLQVQQHQKVRFYDSEKIKIKTIASEYGVTKFSDHLDLIQQLTIKISQNDADGLSQGEKLSQVGLQIQKVLESRLDYIYKKLKLTPEESLVLSTMTDMQLAERVKTLQPKLSKVKIAEQVQFVRKSLVFVKNELLKARYTLAENIAKLERFKLADYEFVESHALNKPGYTLVKLSEYPEFAMALAKQTPPPKDYGTGGLVTLQEYRDVVSNNLWLFTLRGHDLKHIHFAYGHPFAKASLLRTARSKNYLRYFLTAAVYEGVDKVQYRFERNLTAYFNKNGYTLQEAMVYLASATQAELVDITQKIGVSIATDAMLESLRNWKPRALKPELIPVGHKTVEYFEKDIVSFISRSIDDLADPRINFYMRPELLRKGQVAPAGTYLKPGESIHTY